MISATPVESSPTSAGSASTARHDTDQPTANATVTGVVLHRRRPKPVKLAADPGLRRLVLAKLKARWSPQQIARFLAPTAAINGGQRVQCSAPAVERHGQFVDTPPAEQSLPLHGRVWRGIGADGEDELVLTAVRRRRCAG
jgi:hypothetical protein